MYYMDKRLVFIPSIVSVLLLAGCITEERISSDEIRDRTVDAMMDVGSYAFNGTMRITFSEDTGNIRGMKGMELMEERRGEMDVHNKRGHTVMKTVMWGLTVKETYLLDDIEYVKIDNADWMMGNRNPELWKGYDYLAKELDLLDNEVIKYRGEETIDGVHCYILEARPDPEELLERWSQVEIMGIVNVEDLRSTPVKNFNVRMWISRDDFLVRKTKASAELEGEGISVVMDMILNFHGYGEKLSIEPPESAKEVKRGTKLPNMPSYA